MKKINLNDAKAISQAFKDMKFFIKESRDQVNNYSMGDNYIPGYIHTVTKQSRLLNNKLNLI